MSLAPHLQSKINLLAAREFFFENIYRTLLCEPNTLEVLLGNDCDFVPPRLLAMNVELGSLVLEVTPNFIGEGEESRFYYSVLVTGDILRIGIFMPVSRLLTVPVHSEVRARLQRTWSDESYCMLDYGNGVLYEWTFRNFHPDDWSSSERYVLGLRYLHFCFLSQIHRMVIEMVAPTLLHN